MPKPISVPVRQKLYERALRGESTASLAAAFRLPLRTVRHLCRRFRERGADAIRPDYHASGPVPHAFGGELRDAALALRRAHPTWGAVLIRVAPEQQDLEVHWPGATTLRRWFRQAGLAPAPPPRRPAGRDRRPRPGPRCRTRPGRWTPRNTSPWPTGRRSRGCGWSTSAQEPSWGRRFSPRAFWSQVEPRATQTALRGLFGLWGLPRGLRVDNGMPWGSQGNLPTDLVCWLAGLGLTVTANPPRRPEDNGVVERSQGVGQAWGEPWLCRSAGELQPRMDELDR